jgi:mRNA interferase RelE/StbE
VAKYKVFIKPSAVKELKKILNPDFTRITNRIKKLASDPHPQGCEKLSNDEKYRVRQGNYRIIYLIVDDKEEIIIYKIGYRGDVYK